MKGQLEELGEETDENVENISKMQGQILNMTKGKVNIFDGAGNFKSTYEIMQGIANVWDELSSIDQANLLETIAGKNRANDVAALLSNWKNVEAAVKSATEAEGSAARENAKYVDSIQGRLDKMTTSWQSFANTFMSSDFLKGAISALTGFIEGLEKVIDTVGTFPTLIGTISAGFSLFKNDGFFSVLNKDVDGAQKQLALLGKSFTDIKRDFASGQNIFTSLFKKSITKADVGYITDYFKQVKSGVPVGQAYANTLSHASVAGKKMAVSIKSGEASMDSLKTATTGGKAALLGLEVAATAANIALSMGLSIAIQLVVEGIMKLVNAKEELAEKVEEITSKFKEQHDELTKLKGDYDTTDESSMISKYEKLSKGVDNLGRNVSLTSEEYSEYQSIVNSIADQIPSLISGYDEQGNALLSCKGNVEELTEAYEKLIHAQNNKILTNTGNIENDFKNSVQSAEKNGYWTPFWNYSLTSSTVKDIEKALNGAYTEEEIKKLFEYDGNIYSTEYLENGFKYREVGNALKDAGVDMPWYFDWGLGGEEVVWEKLSETMKSDPEKIRSIISNFNADLEETTNEMKSIAQAKLSEAFDVSSAISGLNYGNINEDLQSIAYQTVNSLDYDFFSELSKDGKTIEQWTKEMLDQLNSISKEDNKTIESGFDLQTKFNGGDISYGEYVKGIQNVESIIDGLDLKEEVKEQLKLSLDTEEVTENYEALKERLTSDKYNIQMETEEAEEFLNGLSTSEYSVAVDLMASGEVDLSKFDIKSFREYIEKQAKLQEALNFTIAIDVEAESIEVLNTAMAESVSGAGLSSEAIGALKVRYAELESEGYNLSAMFEETANGIHLNREAVSEFEQKLASNKLAETDKQLGVLKSRYDELATEIDNCTDASDRAALYTEQQSIVDKINDLATLASQYEGLTSAYNAWQSAESAGSERDMYENIISGFETIEDELSRGWLDDGTIKFLELLTGKTNLAGKSGKELKKIYNDLDDTIKNTTYSIRDFFTVDEDGNSTNTGVYNFLDAIGQLEEEAFGGKDVVKRDDKGNIIGFDFELVAKKDENGNVIKNGDQVIAEALGISEELVQIMVRAADDAGFVVNLEGAYTQLADLKTEAEAARDTLISLQKNGLAKLKGVDVNFDLDAEGNDLVAEQEKAVKLLDKFKKDGKIDLTMEGAQQALDIAEYLTIKLDDLTEPKIMKIDVSEVDEDLRDPIEKMQEIVKLSKEKNLVSLTGDKKEIEETQNEINKVAKELEELDPEIKAQVGIDEKWDAETIASKIEKGEIEVPAELKLDVQMSDDLKDMRLMMMNQLGLVSDNEVKLKVGFDIDESIVDGLTDEQKEIVVKYIVENKEEIDKYTDEEKETVVKLIADGVNLEKYEVEDKEAIVNYIANGEEADGWTPEAKDAFVKYLVDGGEPDKFDPENKESWVVYGKDSSVPDNYDPEDPDATVTYDKDSKIPDGYDPDKNGIVTFKKDSSAIDNWKPTVTGVAKFALSMVIPKSVRSALAAVGISIANGTANLDGTAFADGSASKLNVSGRAFARGDWRTKKTETALTGELGREIVVTPDNHWYTVGDTGAEFAKIPKGSIVFNHKIVVLLSDKQLKIYLIAGTP